MSMVNDRYMNKPAGLAELTVPIVLASTCVREQPAAAAAGAG